MPISLKNDKIRDDGDCSSMYSQMTDSTAWTFADSLSSQLTRKTCKRGFTFNVMSVGPQGVGKTTLLSTLFNKNLDVPLRELPASRDGTDIPIDVNTKSFDIEEKGIRLKLSIADCQNYGLSINLKNSYKPIVKYIDKQFAEYHKREYGYDRRKIQDTIVHCLFFFISALGHGLTELDFQFLTAVHEKVNIVPIIAKADALTEKERLTFKHRVMEDLKKRNINIYEMPDADSEDPDDFKRDVYEIKAAMPFAVSSMSRIGEKLLTRQYDWGTIDLENPSHSDYLLLKKMLHLNISDLRDKTFENFYEEYRVKMMNENSSLRSFAPSTIQTSSH